MRILLDECTRRKLSLSIPPIAGSQPFLREGGYSNVQIAMLRFQPMPSTLFHLIAAAIGSTVLTSAAVFGIVKLLLKPVWTALNGYATTYASGQASIDVRIRNVEKLAEEQARLTRTVEGIKDEIAARAKSRDNRWAFRKDVYCSLIKTTSELISNLADFRHIRLQNGETASLEDRRKELTKELMNHVRLAPLATADNVLGAIEAATPKISGASVDFASRDWQEQITATIAALEALLKTFQDSGRKDLWDTQLPS